MRNSPIQTTKNKRIFLLFGLRVFVPCGQVGEEDALGGPEGRGAQAQQDGGRHDRPVAGVQVGHYVQEVRGLAKDDGPLDAQLVHHARGQEDAAHD